MNDDEILTLSEVAKILKMNTRRVAEFCRSRRQARAEHPFPAFSLHAKAKRVRKSDLMAWIERKAQQH
jgi:hypothetical protein